MATMMRDVQPTTFLGMPVLAWALIAAGCGSRGPLGQVDGIITLEGQPLSNVLVVFIPDGGDGAVARSVGIADAAGKFTLQTEEGKPGAPIGSYRVVVEDLAVRDAPRDADGTIVVMPPQRIPQRYASPLTTTATAEVREGRQQTEVKLTISP